MVGRHRTCRNTDLCHLVAVPTGMAYGGEPLSGGHDYFCGIVCGSVSNMARGTRLGRILYFPLSEYTGSGMAQLQLSLLWDVFAVGTYLTVSVLFWYAGLLPDLATIRDRAKTK